MKVDLPDSPVPVSQSTSVIFLYTKNIIGVNSSRKFLHTYSLNGWIDFQQCFQKFVQVNVKFKIFMKWFFDL